MKDEIIDTTSWKTMPEVAVLLPCHNEADIIEKVVREFYEELNGKIPFEIVVCEDGSVDRTKEVLRKLTKDIPLKVILGSERKGYAGGLKDGLKLVRAPYVSFVDADGQHSASDLWKLYALKERYDVVSGCRVKRADDIHRRIMSRIFQVLARVVFHLPGFRDITAPFRLVKTNVAKDVARECAYMKESFWTEFTIRTVGHGFHVLEVPVQHRERLGGCTRVYTWSKIPKIAVDQLSGLLKIKFDGHLEQNNGQDG
jgi:glycosyltransferase involved in cell wall biosynthesis